MKKTNLVKLICTIMVIEMVMTGCGSKQETKTNPKRDSKKVEGEVQEERDDEK